MTGHQSLLSRGIVLTVLAPSAAFVLHDFVFQAPDNQHEASLGFFLTVLGLLFVWAVGGCLAGRRARTAIARAGVGMITAIISVGILWLMFFALNRTFPDRMSYEPDRIRAFGASGHSTMREYVDNMGPGPFPLLMGVAVVVSTAASLLGRKSSTTPAPRSTYEA